MKTDRAAILVSLALALGSAAAGAQGGVEVSPLQPAPPAAVAAPPPLAPPRDSAAAERDAEMSYNQGRLDDAIAQYEEAARLQSAPAERVRLLVVVSALQHRQARNDAAIDAMTRALTIDPGYVLSQDNFTPTFQDIYYEGRKRAIEQRAKAALDSVHTGDERLHGRDFTAARAAYREALAIDPTLVNALFGLAEVDREQGNREAALAGYQKLLALRRGNAGALNSSLQVAALNNVGILYYDKGFYEDAESALAEAAQLDPKSAETWTNLGLARRKLGKRKEAAEALRRAYTLDPENEAAASNLALTYLDGSNWIEAVSLLLEATRKSPENPQLWLNLGIAQQGMDNLDGAIGSFVKARDLDPDNRHGFAALAAGYLAPAYAKQGKLDLASEQALKQVAWSPQDVNGWINLGQAQLAAGKMAEARQSLERAQTLDPARPEVSNNLGSAYYRLGDYARAAEAFQRALTMRSDYLAAADNLGMAKRRVAELEQIQRRVGLTIDTLQSGSKGVVISGVAPESIAARAGMAAGDILVRIEGNAVANAADVAAYLALQPPPRALACEVFRGGKVVKAKLKLG